MKTILIRIGHKAPQEVSWALLAANTIVSTTVDSIEAIGQIIIRKKIQKVLVLVPGENVLLTTVTLPATGDKISRQAVPFALEEQLAADVEDLHFAIGKQQPNGSRSVAVVALHDMEQWLEMLVQAKIEPNIIFPEQLALPYAENTISLLVDSGPALIRSGPEQGFVVDEPNMALVINTFAKANKERLLHLFHCQTISNKEYLQALDFTIVEQKMESSLAVFAKGLAQRQTFDINLLQGRFGPHAEWHKIWTQWRLPLVLLLTALLFHTIVLVVEWNNLRTEKKELRAQIEQVLRQTFPKTKKIVNPRAQMAYGLKKLSQQTEPQSLLPLLEKIGPILLATPGYALHQIRYQDKRIDLDLAIKDLKTLDQLKTRLSNNSGLEIEVKNASTKKKHVLARLMIREPTQ